MLTESQNTNSFENRIKEPKYINFSITGKMEQNNLTANQQTFDTYYNYMSASYWRLQSLVNPTGYRVTQHYDISQLSKGGCGRGGHRRGRGYRGRGYVCGCGHGRGVQGGSGGRSYGHNPYEVSIRYGTFMAEARVHPADKWIILYLQQKNNIQ